MPLAKSKLSSFFWLAVIALAFAALTPIVQQSQIDRANDAPATTQRSHSDTGGQTASPNPSGSGFDQEEKVRQLLAKQYEQRYGASDEVIRSTLGIKGKVADFVGYNAKQNRWLIAESKGSDLGAAFEQLENTASALVKLQPHARLELRLYLDAKNFQTLSQGGKISGWTIRDGTLGWYNEADEFVHAMIEGIKVLVQVAP